MRATGSFHHSSNKCLLRNLSSSIFFLGPESCLNGGVIDCWKDLSSQRLLGYICTLVVQSVSKHSKTLGFFQMKTGKLVEG